MFDMGTKEKKRKICKKRNMLLKYIPQEVSDKEKLSMEKEMLGIYISGHPLEKYRKLIQQQTNISTLDINQIEEQNNTENTEHGYNAIAKFKDGQQIRYAGIITSIKKKYTKNNKIMAFVTIEDLYGSVEIIVFESAYMKSKRFFDRRKYCYCGWKAKHKRR